MYGLQTIRRIRTFTAGDPGAAEVRRRAGFPAGEGAGAMDEEQS